MSLARHLVPATGLHHTTLSAGETSADTPLNVVGETTHVLVAPEDSAGCSRASIL